MPLHLIKLCVGADSVQDLEDWIKQKLKDKRKRGEKPEHIHTTRMVPKRADELIDGGSLYLGDPRRDHVPRAHPRRSGRSSTRTASAAAASCSIPKWCWCSRARIAPSRAGAISTGKDAPRDLDSAAPGAAAMPEKHAARAARTRPAVRRVGAAPARLAAWRCRGRDHVRSAAECTGWPRSRA